MNRNITIAAAVAAALSAGSAFAAGPSVAQIAAIPAANTINIMGSSAIKNALLGTIETNFFGGANYTVVTSNGSNGNFLGVAGTPAAQQASHSGLYAIWIRYEGGSVAGYLPIVNKKGVKEISGPALTANPVTINGAGTGNGTDDSFQFASGGAFATVIPDLGIGDVEPQALIGNNYPSNYVTTVWGPQNPAGMFGLTGKQLVDEVYALEVNQSGSTWVSTAKPLNLTIPTIQNILTGNFTDWSSVVDANGLAVVNGSTPIYIASREAGSGSRAATDILLAGDFNSQQTTTLLATAPFEFSTGDVLTAANNAASGALTYATIDNVGSTSYPNMKPVSINGVVPSNLAAANGAYPFWVEAEYVINPATTADTVAINNIVTSLQTASSTAALADIMAIPYVTAANSPLTQLNTVNIGPAPTFTAYPDLHQIATGYGFVPTGGGTATVYINPFTRSGKTNGIPVSYASVAP